ncbi:MAG: hypothetical protein ACRDLN_02690 [Solirubrobacteraceae bacterium]
MQQTVAPVNEALRATKNKTKAALARTNRATSNAVSRATTTDPLREPPLHGTNPNGQGGVAVVDIDPSNERPQGANPDGSDSGEEVVAGRARGEQTASGAYHGHISIVALFGSEILGVDTNEGETKHGPLEPIQANVLDPLCTNTDGQVCLSVLTADSETTASGSKNDFAVARANLLGIRVGAAESGGNISETAECQSAAGGAGTANVAAAGGVVANVANSAVTSESCKGKAVDVKRVSQVIGLGGTQIPLPAAGCADGTPDTVGGLPGLLPIVCNAEELAGASVVREALDVFVLNVGGNSLLKETTAAAQANTVAPKGGEGGGPQCTDGKDNDGDGKVDGADPGCHSDNDPNNPNSLVPTDNDETDAAPTGPSSGPPSDGEDGKTECSDGRDNDGDGKVDAKDPGCHSDGNPNNPSSYNEDDDDESDEAGAGGNGGAGDGAGTLDEGALPFTGGDVVGIALAGLLMLAGGLLMRRREDTRLGA